MTFNPSQPRDPLGRWFGGGFHTKRDLALAIKSVPDLPTAKDRTAAIVHAKEAATRLDAHDLIPGSWGGGASSTASGKLSTLEERASKANAVTGGTGEPVFASTAIIENHKVRVAFVGYGQANRRYEVTAPSGEHRIFRSKEDAMRFITGSAH